MLNAALGNVHVDPIGCDLTVCNLVHEVPSELPNNCTYGSIPTKTMQSPLVLRPDDCNVKEYKAKECKPNFGVCVASEDTRKTNRRFIYCWLLLCCLSGISQAEELGSVDTKFNLLSPDDSIKVEVFADPKISGIACYLSRAQKGGYRGALGIAEDTSDASIDCRQTGPVAIAAPFEEGEPVFRERRSLIFKSLKVVRFCDEQHNAVVYLAYSERVIEGSPKNSISAVPIKPWPGGSEVEARCRYED